MRRTILLTALLALTIAPAAMAKMTTVKGAKCTACHTGMPAKKDNLTKVAADMLAKHKTEASCKECHGVAEGKLTNFKPVKK